MKSYNVAEDEADRETDFSLIIWLDLFVQAYIYKIIFQTFMLHEFIYIIWKAPYFHICGKDMPENHGREEGSVEEPDLRGAYKI